MVTTKNVKFDGGYLQTWDYTPVTRDLNAYEQNLQLEAKERALRMKYGMGTKADKDAYKEMYDNVSGGANASGGAGGSSNLFSNLGDYANTFGGFADQSLGRAKDWAQFQLGINRQQGEQDFDFRNREATRDFGFNTALTGQRIAGDQALENLRQTSETGRLEKSLQTQRDMQAADFTNQTTQRAQQAALARLGFSR